MIGLGICVWAHFHLHAQLDDKTWRATNCGQLHCKRWLDIGADSCTRYRAVGNFGIALIASGCLSHLAEAGARRQYLGRRAIGGREEAKEELRVWWDLQEAPGQAGLEGQYVFFSSDVR